MSSESNPSQGMYSHLMTFIWLTTAACMSAGVRNAKKKALDNAGQYNQNLMKIIKLTCKNIVWLPVKMCGKRQQHDMASTQSDKASSQPDKASSQRDKASSQRDKASSQPDKASSQRDKASSQREKASSQRNTASSAQGDPQWGSQPRPKPKTVKKQSRCHIRELTRTCYDQMHVTGKKHYSAPSFRFIYLSHGVTHIQHKIRFYKGI
jgi:hypothetical protein